MFFQNGTRVPGGDLLYLDPTLGRRHDHDSLHRPVDDHAKIQFTLYAESLFHQDLQDFLSLGSRLMGNQLHAEHVPSNLFSFLGAVRDLHPAALPTPTSVDLRLYDDHARPQLPSDGFRLFSGRCNTPTRHRDSVFLQSLFSLILMNFHRDVESSIQCEDRVSIVAVIANVNPAPLDNAKHHPYRPMGGSQLQPAFSLNERS